ncbi:MAG: hypothetical protein VX431_00940 [Planctomycetota bacterium]|nr:hypothetical protein [Planctomycetota bacterium]
MTLGKEELVEQAYFFKTLLQRIREAMPMQEVLASIEEEILATTDLPKAIAFLRSELAVQGGFARAMGRLDHYFTPFQTFVVSESEDERGKFDLRTGLEILCRDAEYRAGEPSPQGIFLYQFESICRNRLRYDPGLAAMAEDPLFTSDWRDWVLTVRRQVGLVELADLIYVRSGHYQPVKDELQQTILFGEQEGRIARANRRKDPLLLFAALQRQLGYPKVPRPQPVAQKDEKIEQMSRRIERLEGRMKLLEEESRGGIQIERFFSAPETPPPDPSS